MNVQQYTRRFGYVFLFVGIIYSIFGIILGTWYAHAAVLPSALPDALKKKVGIGKEVSISGWAWNSAMGWVSQRGSITGGGSYGAIKNTTEGVTGWSWSPNYGWICWGETCLGSSLTEVKYGKNKPSVGSPASEVEPNVIIEPVQVFPVRNSIVEGTEQCDHGITGDTSCDSNGKGIAPTLPATALCGNGIKETGETCDDGDFINTNACDSTCTGDGEGIPNLCGNGIKETGETCDDGDRNNINACKNDCTLNGLTVRQDVYDFQVSGWIKIIGLKDDGWISLRGAVDCNGCLDDGQKYGVTYDPNYKEFRGWAWSPKLGWIVFSGRTLYDTAYRYAKLSKGTGSGETFKMYDVLPGAISGTSEVRVTASSGSIQLYIIEESGSGETYTIRIKSVLEYAVGSSDPILLTDQTLWEWTDITVYDEKHCPEAGCIASYYDIDTGKSTWKTQLLSPWIQTAGGNVFSRKGFGGNAVAFRPSSQYLLYSGGVTLEKDVRTGERLEFACCTDDKVIITKIGLPEIIANTSYADLSSGGEVEIIKRGRSVEKKGGGDVQSDMYMAFSSLLEGEGRRLKKKGGDVEVRIVHPLYASIEKNKTGMTDNLTIVVTRTRDGKLKKDGQDFPTGDVLKKVLSSEERIVGALTSLTSECDDPTKKCSLVGRKKDGADNIVKADAFNRDTRPDIAFPQKQQNVRRNTLGSLDIDKFIVNPNTGRIKNKYGYTVEFISNEGGFGNFRTNGMGNTMLVVQGDISIGQSSDMAKWVFQNGEGDMSGAGTIIVNGGNLHIYRPLQYGRGDISDLKNLASIAWIVLEKNGKGGNIIFGDCIPPTSVTVKVNDISITQPVASAAGIFFAEGTISTGRGDGNECHFTDGDLPLYVNGMMIARKFNFQRVYSGDPDLNLASEFIQDTGRGVVNTPPGLEDILKSLPTW